MSEIIASPVNIVEKETRDNYGVSDAVRLIVNSFRFSQGETMLQKNLLEQIGYYTHDKLDKATILQAVEPATQAVEKIVSNRNLHARSHSVLAKDEVIEYADFLAKHISERQPTNFSLTTGVIRRDYKFIIERPGRDRAHNTAKNPAADPYLSHFVFYSLMGQTTGSPEYDKIFANAAHTYEEQIKPEYPMYVSMVNELIRKYLAHHPDQINLLSQSDRAFAEAA